jgi:hypothetical protein
MKRARGKTTKSKRKSGGKVLPKQEYIRRLHEGAAIEVLETAIATLGFIEMAGERAPDESLHAGSVAEAAGVCITLMRQAQQHLYDVGARPGASRP